MLVGQPLGCKGSELSLVNLNGWGDERGPIGEIICGLLFSHLRGKIHISKKYEIGEFSCLNLLMLN